MMINKSFVPVQNHRDIGKLKLSSSIFKTFLLCSQRHVNKINKNAKFLKAKKCSRTEDTSERGERDSTCSMSRRNENASSLSTSQGRFGRNGRDLAGCNLGFWHRFINWTTIMFNEGLMNDVI